ncbi:heterokaryon incompatibility protein-domain-containing protein [Xylariaceae sp. AK1471]|nr:heterokaryon incompatibility protein-domain-containing protein [Xylariaceae sp. AK1471]
MTDDGEDEKNYDYATLSHCWGDKQFEVLNLQTTKDFLAGVYIRELPQTFQDTVVTVQRLGIRYLWIDCYCIIQGYDVIARADWESESRQMGKVYQNGLINIGAAANDGAHKGLFKNRDPVFIIISWSPTKSQGYSSFEIELVPQRKRYSQISSFAFPDLAQCSLYKRGWVVQECVMACRMLSFTDSRIVWQCSIKAANELYPDREWHPFMNIRNYDRLPSPFWALTSNTRKEANDSSWITRPEYQHSLHLWDVQMRWFVVLETYCQAELSYPDKDIIRAIEGVGSEFERLTGDTFSHGTLGSTLLDSLLWSIGKTNQKKPNRGPTWHWSSFNEPKSFCSVSKLLSFPLAYPFLSDNCEPLATSASKDFWPNLMCIGRLVDPESLGLESKDTDDAFRGGRRKYEKGDFYLPLRINIMGSMLWTLGESIFQCLISLHLRMAPNHTFRRIDLCESTFSTDLDSILAKLAKIKPRLIIIS